MSGVDECEASRQRVEGGREGGRREGRREGGREGVNDGESWVRCHEMRTWSE